MLQRNDSMRLSLSLPAERQPRIDSLVVKARMRATMRSLAEWLSALGAWRTRLGRDLAYARFAVASFALDPARRAHPVPRAERRRFKRQGEFFDLKSKIQV